MHLFILRHAHAASPQPGKEEDFDRPLTSEGRKAARALGQWMVKKGYGPDYILCSPAVRTCQTLEGLRQAFNDLGEAEYIKALYNAPEQTLLRHIQDCPDEARAVLIVAHNFGIHRLALMLAGSGDINIRASLRHAYEPGTMTVLESDVERWSDFREGAGRAVDLFVPGVPTFS